MLVTSIFSFSHNVFKSFLSQGPFSTMFSKAFLLRGIKGRDRVVKCKVFIRDASLLGIHETVIVIIPGGSLKVNICDKQSALIYIILFCIVGVQDNTLKHHLKWLQYFCKTDKFSTLEPFEQMSL